MTIKGIYKLPAIKHTFLVMSSGEEGCDNETMWIENRKKMEYFEHILELKDHMHPKETPLWRLKLVHEDDFLLAIKRYRPKEIVSSSQSLGNPEELELLSVNLLKNLVNPLYETYETPKFLGSIREEDIIQVFI